MATQQGGAEIRTDDKAPTITAAAGMSGNNQPVVALPYTLKIRSGVAVDSNGKAAGKGALVQTDKEATLATTNDQYLFQPVEPMGIIDNIGGQAEYGYESQVNGTLRAGAQGAIFYAVENHPTASIGLNGGQVSPTPISRMSSAVGTTQDNLIVCEPKPTYCLQGNGIDRADTAGCNGKGWKEDTCYTLNTIDRPAVAYLASGKDAVGTLMANAGTKLWLGNQEAFSGDYHIIEETPVRYIVRRLTPTECARLQGFADRWGDIDEKDSFTPEEFEFWHEVRNTHAAINGKKVQEYTKKQMLTWYNKLHTDSAEYKMWGNGVALPPALYCMQGLLDALNAETAAQDDDWMN